MVTRRRKRQIGALAVVALALAAGGYSLARHNQARPVSLDEAHERLSASSTTSIPGDDRPDAGVYEYHGTGLDKLSKPSLTQGQGPTIPGTVEWLDGGCWRFRVDYSTNHWQSSVYCPTGLGLEERTATTYQRWVVGAAPIDNTTVNTCDAGTVFLPSDPVGGDRWSTRCDIANDLVAGTSVATGSLRYIGDERIRVGDTSVRTRHFLRIRQLTGGQEGTERTDLWLEAASGLPIRNRHDIDVRTDTPLGTSHYTEHGEYRLRSLEPT